MGVDPLKMALWGWDGAAARPAIPSEDGSAMADAIALAREVSTKGPLL
jgi:hypothetical protein